MATLCVDVKEYSSEFEIFREIILNYDLFAVSWFHRILSKHVEKKYRD